MFTVDRNDLMFSAKGDFIIKHGDLDDTVGIPGLGFIEEVELRIKSSQGDWYFDENKGANLELYEGRMITPALLDSIRETITSSLTYQDFLVASDFYVDIAIIDINEVAVKVIFSDNIQKLIDYRIQDVRIVFDLKNATPRIVRT